MIDQEQNGYDHRWLRRKEAAEYVRKTFGVPCAPSTLAKLASVGGGPPYKRFGRHPMYFETGLRAWVQSRMSETYSSTSEY